MLLEEFEPTSGGSKTDHRHWSRVASSGVRGPGRSPRPSVGRTLEFFALASSPLVLMPIVFCPQVGQLLLALGLHGWQNDASDLGRTGGKEDSVQTHSPERGNDYFFSLHLK